MKKLLSATVLGAVLAVSACTATSGPSAARMSQATTSEQSLESYSQRYMVQGAIAGCLIGILAGTVIANNTGDGDVETGEVLTACAAGAAFGAVGGRVVASRQEQYGSTQEATEAAVSAAELELADARRVKSVVQTAVADNVSAINNAKTQLASGEITQEQYADELAYAQSVADNIDRAKTGLRSEVKAAEEVLANTPVNDPNHGKLQSTINDLQAEYEAVDAEYERLASVIADADLGRA